MGNKKIGLGLMLNLIGAMFAYLIGSGFASGQETMQYFSGWGSVWASLGVAAIALLLSCLAYIAYSYAGRTRGLKDLAGIYDFYAGNVFGKLFQVFAWLFNACCYMFMISGFGNVIHQQWGISIPIGSAIGVVLSVTIAVMGLNKIIDIIGKVGPIIVLFTLFIGIVAAFRYYPMIAEGNAAINSGDVDVIRAGSNWVTAGLSFAGCNLLLVSAFVGTIGYNLREYKFIYNQLIMIISSGGIMLVSFLMGLNHIGNIQTARILRKNVESGFVAEDEITHVLMWGTAGADARMGGSDYPTMVSTASGNQGLMVVMAPWASSQYRKMSAEDGYRAVAFALLMNTFMKYASKEYVYMPPTCSCATTAAPAAAAGVAFLHGLTPQQINDMLCTAQVQMAGVVCDGAKPSCATRMYVALFGSLQAMMMAKEGIRATNVEGFVHNDLKVTLENLYRLQHDVLHNKVDAILWDIVKEQKVIH